ncbi:glutathione S-transferase [Annulohypoxylon maeteangense]|uniref:glutathione S-transferase n=1 Tax=Annulohypoxylon maeteangense TaxID=1927788 RepID=UPI00200868C9|nr:glutathione S-transferase [Annulohypoxylon maeteangense]KAI0887995.1 glutathione S-transferase [Annulohypoxylon maeteangense]
MSANTFRSLVPQSIRIPSVRLSSWSYLRQYNNTTTLYTLYHKKPFSTSRTTAQKPPTSTQEQLDPEMSEPTGLIAKSGIELLTFGTPNGHKVSIILEELKAAYGKEYTWQSINIMKNTQKEPWFTAINPNGRIPAIVDHDRNDFAVFEGLPILTYLTRHYDPENKFSFPVESDDYSVAEQWMAWQHGGVGPMQGQANHFFRFAKEKIPYATQRYVGESERLYGILDKRLEGRDYIVGPGKGKYSIADINIFGWANMLILSGIDISRFPNIQKWLDRINERPAVKKGLAIPQESSFTNAAYLKTLATDPEKKAQAEESDKYLKEAQEKYGYKYTTP